MLQASHSHSLGPASDTTKTAKRTCKKPPNEVNSHISEPPKLAKCPSGYAMAVVSYDDETQIVVPVQGFLPQVFTFSSPPFVESSQLGRAPPIDGPIDPWVGHVDLAPHRLPTSEPRV